MVCMKLHSSKRIMTSEEECFCFQVPELPYTDEYLLLLKIVDYQSTRRAGWKMCTCRPRTIELKGWDIFFRISVYYNILVAFPISNTQ